MRSMDFAKRSNGYKYEVERENSVNVVDCSRFRSERAHPEAVHVTLPAAIFRCFEVRREGIVRVLCDFPRIPVYGRHGHLLAVQRSHRVPEAAFLQFFKPSPPRLKVLPSVMSFPGECLRCRSYSVDVGQPRSDFGRTCDLNACHQFVAVPYPGQTLRTPEWNSTFSVRLAQNKYSNRSTPFELMLIAMPTLSKRFWTHRFCLFVS